MFGNTVTPDTNVPPDVEFVEFEKNSTSDAQGFEVLQVATNFWDWIEILGDATVGATLSTGTLKTALVVNGTPFRVAVFGVMTA
jgi:hypothetical protein